MILDIRSRLPVGKVDAAALIITLMKQLFERSTIPAAMLTHWLLLVRSGTFAAAFNGTKEVVDGVT